MFGKLPFPRFRLVHHDEVLTDWIRFALDEFPLKLEKPKIRLGEVGVEGMGLSDEERELVQRFEPWGRHDTPGFFCARFRKVGEYR